MLKLLGLVENIREVMFLIRWKRAEIATLIAIGRD